MSDTVGVALTRCFFCQESDRIILNTRLWEGAAKKVKSMHGKIIDMEPCPKCAEWMKRGILFISVRDDQEAELQKAREEKRMPNPYRTGKWCVIKTDAVEAMPIDKKVKEEVLRRRWSFVPDEAWTMLGLPREDKAE